MDSILRTAPAVFAVGDNYQIMVPVTAHALMWVRVGEEEYYDDSNGIIRSATELHRICVPAVELEKAKEYTLCYRKMIERKPYFSETGEVEEFTYKFMPVLDDGARAYHIADAHNMVDAPVAAAKVFEEKFGTIDFLIMNGDIPNHSGEIEYFYDIYKIAAQITNGNIPIVFAKGNHDMRGIYAENIAEYTPCENGNSFFTFRLGNIWGLVLDTGEDKVDSHEEYGNTVCCHYFRKRETRFIDKVIADAKAQYNAQGIDYRVVVVHNPFTIIQKDPFTIEKEMFGNWTKKINENINPDAMLCGHMHYLDIHYPDDEKNLHKAEFPVVVGSKPTVKENYFAGAGFIFKNGKIQVVFCALSQINNNYGGIINVQI